MSLEESGSHPSEEDEEELSLKELSLRLISEAIHDFCDVGQRVSRRAIRDAMTRGDQYSQTLFLKFYSYISTFKALNDAHIQRSEADQVKLLQYSYRLSQQYQQYIKIASETEIEDVPRFKAFLKQIITETSEQVCEMIEKVPEDECNALIDAMGKIATFYDVAKSSGGDELFLAAPEPENVMNLMPF